MLKMLSTAGRWAITLTFVALGVIVIHMAWPSPISRLKDSWDEGGNALAQASLEACFLLLGLLLIFLAPTFVRPRWGTSGTPSFAVLIVLGSLVLASGWGFVSNFHPVRYYDSCPGPGPC